MSKGRLQQFETSTGYTLGYRVLALDIQASIQAAVRAEWARGEGGEPPPQPPVQRIETGPDQFEEKVHDTHPDHLNALAEYDRKVAAEVQRRTLRLISDYAVVCEVDEEAVIAHRAALKAVGVTLDDDDRTVFLWHIAVPDSEEQETLAGHIFGAKYAAYLEAQRRAFRRALERTAAGVPDAA